MIELLGESKFLKLSLLKTKIIIGLLVFFGLSNTMDAQPTIVSFTPSSGVIGTTVTISGTNFSTTINNNIVFFGAVKATVISAAIQSLTVIVPAGATYEPITVTTNNLTAYSSRPFIITFTNGGADIFPSSFDNKIDFQAGGPGHPNSWVSDLDGDGKPDLVTINSSANKIEILRNITSGGSISFAPKIEYFIVQFPANTYYFSIADIDGDGKPDISISDAGSLKISVFRNTSTVGIISFAPKVDFSSPYSPFNIAICDLDADGKPDIVTGFYYQNTVSVLRNTSTVGIISFASQIEFSSGTNPYSIRIGELDGDGKQDLVVANTGENTVSILRNISSTGVISFSPKVDFSIGNNTINYPRFVKIGDLDGDYRQDIVVTNYTSNTISTLRNTSSIGVISFSPKVDFSTGNNPSSISINDLNGDGKSEIAITNPGDQTVSIYRNISASGDISFSPRVNYSSGNYPFSVTLGDLNEDGKCELAVVNTVSNTFSVFKNLIFVAPYKLPYIPAQNAIKQNGNQFTIADPIQLGTGTYSYTHNDIKISSINGSINFTRFYNSLNNSVLGPLGYGWSHTYNYFLANKQDTAWDIHYPDGHVSTFIPMNTLGQSFPVFSGTFDSLRKNNNNSFSLFTKEKQHYHFDPTGKLDSIIDLNNNITRLHYTGTTLDSIVAPGGRSLVLTYSANKITSVKDPLNRIYSYTYDANNNLIAVIDANNGTATFTYDTVHRMLIAKNPLNNTIVDNTYNSSGKVISQKDVYNQVTSIVYNSPNPGDATVTNPDNSIIVAHHDAFIRKTSEKDELNYIKSYTYDANSNENGFTNENNQSERRLFDNQGNLLTDTLPGGKITRITYNYFNSPVQITDAKSFQKTFYYNSVNNNLDSIRYPDNSIQAFIYNAKGQVIQSVDGNGNATTYTYSPAGDLLSTQSVAGIKQFAYDAAGRKVSSTDENGHITNYVYDNNDNITLITDPLGRTIQNTYDANNQLLTVKDKKGFITTYTYDNKGRKITSTNPKAGVTSYAYDVRDNLISITDPENNIISYTYDAKGRKTSTTNALGTTQYQYDAVGNLLKVIDPTNKITEYSYTATNKKNSYKDGLGNTTNYAYDPNDNLTSVTDPLNRVTLNEYDAVNRLVSVTDAANKTTTVTYDNNGNKKTVVDPNGHTQTYNYDAVNRLVNYQDAAANNYNYSYDSAGNNITLTKPTGTIAKVFDAANRVITVNNSTGNNYNFSYDNNDNVITMSNNVGTTTMTYDSLNQLKQYLDPFNKTVSFTYDAAGNKTAIIYPGNKTVNYTFDNANNLKTVSDWLNHTFTYMYDSAGRVTQLLYPNGAKCNYGFDNAGRLISKINRLSTNTIISGSTFTLDAVGNRIAEQRLAQAPSALPTLSRAYSYANDDRMLSDSIWSFVNDSSGNRTSETNGTDSASYTFSVDNLLNNLMDTAGTNSTYSYDVLGHRIAKVAGSNSNKYVLDISGSLSQVLQITDASGVVKSNYVYGLGLLERVDAADSVLYYHFDAQHNTTLLTGQDSAIKDTYTYDPFGTMLSHTGTTTQPFTFLGEYGVEQESPELYYVRARYYDAVNGRFLSKDIFPYDLNEPQTINRYVYSINNPVSIFDYTGLYGEQDDFSEKQNDDRLAKLSEKIRLQYQLENELGYYSNTKSNSKPPSPFEISGDYITDILGFGASLISPYISIGYKSVNYLVTPKVAGAPTNEEDIQNLPEERNLEGELLISTGLGVLANTEFIKKTIQDPIVRKLITSLVTKQIINKLR